MESLTSLLNGTSPAIGLLIHSIVRESRLDKNHFTNRVHFEVYRHLPKVPSEVAVSDSYAVITFTRKFNRKLRWSRSECVSAVSSYVLGVNSDGKLFINKIEPRRSQWSQRASTFYTKSNKAFTMIRVSDDEVRRALGYEVDCECSPVKVIPTDRPSRIQGDIVLTPAAGSEAEKAYINEVRSTLDRQVERLLERVILTRVSNCLAEVGVNSTMMERRLVVPGVPRRWPRSKKEEVRDKLLRYIASNIYMADITGSNSDPIVESRDDWGRNVYWRQVSIEWGQVSIDVTIGRGAFGEPHEPLNITAQVGGEAVSRFVDQVLAGFKPEVEPITVIRGRHRITFKGYRSRFSLISKLILLLEQEEHLFTVNLDGNYIAAGQLTISHPEHGTETYAVQQPMYATIGETSVHPDNDARFNQYALSLLS